MSVLHLASWYPNNTGAQDGDFIQRHARAIAVFTPVHLIFVVKDESIETDTFTTTNINGGLTETIIYYKPVKTGITILDKLISLRTYTSIFKAEVRKFFSSHGKPELVHVHVAMRAGLIARWIKKKYGVPFIVSEHWSGYYKTDPDNYFKRDWFWRYSTKQIFREAAWVTAVSDDLIRQLRSIFSVTGTNVIYNSVNTEQFNFNAHAAQQQQQDHRSGSVFRFIHISNLHPIKNVEGIFKVMARLKAIRSDWRLQMVGEIAPGYQQLAGSLGITDLVEWRGCIDHSAVPAELKRSDVLLMFSYHENLSCVVCESLCCGVPVIATRVGGLPEIINDSNGSLVAPADEDELLRHVLNVMEAYAAYKRPEIASEAAALFNEQSVGRQFTGLYEKVLAGTLKSSKSPVR